MTHLDEKALEAANDLAREEFGVMVGSVGPAYITAYISALLPEDSAGLVSELCDAAYRNAGLAGHESRIEYRAASLIQSQAARISELEAGLLVARKWMPVGHRNGLTATENMERDAVDALLKGGRKG